MFKLLPSEQRAVAWHGLLGLVLGAGTKLLLLHWDRQLHVQDIGVQSEKLPELDGGSVYHICGLIFERIRHKKALFPFYKQLHDAWDQFALLFLNMTAEHDRTVTAAEIRKQGDLCKAYAQELIKEAGGVAQLPPADISALLRLTEEMKTTLKSLITEAYVTERRDHRVVP